MRNKSKQVGKEPDISYAIGQDKEIPDLAVEVNYSSGETPRRPKAQGNAHQESGDIDDLDIYLALEVKEVWIWDKDNNLYFYTLENNRYLKVTESIILKPLKSQTIKKYVKIMREKSPRIGKKEFFEYLKK